MSWQDLLNKKIVAFRGYPNRNKKLKAKVQLAIILFDDGQSYIELKEQDKYDYHDCSDSARNIYLCVNKKFWDMAHDTFPEPDGLDNNYQSPF